MSGIAPNFSRLLCYDDTCSDVTPYPQYFCLSASVQGSFNFNRPLEMQRTAFADARSQRSNVVARPAVSGAKPNLLRDRKSQNTLSRIAQPEEADNINSEPALGSSNRRTRGDPLRAAAPDHTRADFDVWERLFSEGAGITLKGIQDLANHAVEAAERINRVIGPLPKDFPAGMGHNTSYAVLGNISQSSWYSLL